MKKNRLMDHLARAGWTKLLRVMKLTAFLVLILVIDVSASLYSQNSKVSVKVVNGTLSEIFNKIEEQSEYRFFYQNEQIRDVERKSIDVSNKNTLELVSDLLGSTELTYRLVDRNIIIFPSSEKNNMENAFQQQKSISGKVTDSSGVSLPGVSVVVKGTTTGVITDMDGKYTLTKVPENAILVFSFVGMKTQEIKVVGQATINVVLAEETIGIDEVVAVGYGFQKKATLSGSIAAVKGDKLQKSTSTNFSNALAGQLPGLVVISRSGEPGNDGSTLRIRGVNTLGDNSPLIVVDGISNRSLDRLDPATIESVTVLKDASAAIYGSQAANGVILVTTKRGTINKPTIQLTLNQGWNSPTVLPKMCDAATYAQLINEIKSYAGQPARYSAEDIQKYADGSDPWGHPNTDWFKETIKNNSPQRYGNLSLSGGVEKIKYFVSIGSNYQDGIYRNSATNYSKSDFRTNLDAKISDNIRLSFDLAGRQENSNYSGAGNGGGVGSLSTFWALQRNYPYLPAYWPNGLPGPDVEYGVNPVVTVTDATGYDKSITYVMQSNMKLDINVPWVKGLSLTANASIDKNFLNRKFFQKPWYLYSWNGVTRDANNVPLLEAVKKGLPEPKLQQWMTDGGKTTLNGLLNYQRTFSDKHNINFLIGVERIEEKSMNIWAFRRYFASETLDQMDAGGDLLKDNGGSGSNAARLNYFGRVNYALSSKYLAEFVWRYDGSYIFPEATRFGFFPGISLGWRVSEEGFWKNSVAFVNDLKIRGSWGQTGNDLITPYQFMATYGYNDTYILNQNAQIKTLTALHIPNPDITWEVANQSNIGFDAQMLNGKINLSADYFYNLRTNILWYRNASVPTSTGLSLPRENIGKVANQGFEMQVGYNNKVRDFNYQVSINGSYAKNKIIFWDETRGVPEYQQSTGRPMNAELYYQAIGVFVDQAAVDAYPHWKNARPGDIIFKDVNEDGKIDGLDRVRSKKTAIPTFTGGFNLNLGYKNFFASVLIQGAAGAERARRTLSGEIGNFVYNDIKDRWTVDNPSSTNPRTWNRALEYWMVTGNTPPNNTYWVINSNYLRLKTVEIGYNVPSNILKKVGVEGLRIYFSGQNLLTITGMKDFDPESPDQAPNSMGTNSMTYPLNKTMNFGLTLTL